MASFTTDLLRTRACVFALALLGAVVDLEGASLRPPIEPITIAHLADPQLGYDASRKGEEAYQACLRRCEKAIAEINRLKPDLVVIAGDMVTCRSDVARDWPRLLKMIDAPWMVTAGNHDLPKADSPAMRKAFADVFGALYSARTVKGWRILSLNGQIERASTPDADYVAWRDREIRSLAESGLPGLVLTHQPPFVVKPDERDTHENYPAARRGVLLDQLVDAGVRAILAGHTHRLQTRAYRGVPILNAETTSNNFDKRPFGFRLLKLAEGSAYDWSFVPCE